jgi:toxin ParE1/3/4
VKVRLTETARAELRAIGDWIAQNDPERAASFTLELLERALTLATFPAAYPLLEAFAHRGIRRCSFGKYLILYRIMAPDIEVLHFIHGARDVAALLGSEPL